MKKYSMKEACEKLGLSYQTLKYYCNEGLIPNVERDENNYRVFDENNINWAKGLICLKKCGMTISEIRKYLNLCLDGKSTIPQRKEMLLERKKNLELEIKSIQDSIEYINNKEKFYNDVLEGKAEYFSFILKD